MRQRSRFACCLFAVQVSLSLVGAARPGQTPAVGQAQQQGPFPSPPSPGGVADRPAAAIRASAARPSERVGFVGRGGGRRRIADYPYARGAFDVGYVFLPRYVLPGLLFNLEVFFPARRGAFHPFFFFPGFQATAPGFLYKKVLERIASHGIVVIAVWRLSTLTDFQDPTIRAFQAIKVVKWTEKHLESKIRKKLAETKPDDEAAAEDFEVDWSRKILGGQSAGAHVAYSLLRISRCKLGFVAVAVVNPVDGRDPFGLIKDFVIPSTWGKHEFPVALPTFVLKAGLDPVQGWLIPFFPPCAPASLSNERFYLGSSGPRWFNEAMLYGHADLLDPVYSGANAALRFCASKKETDKNAYRDFVAGQFVSFIKAMLYPQTHCRMLVHLEEPRAMNIPFVMENHDRPGDFQSVISRAEGGRSISSHSSSCPVRGFCKVLKKKVKIKSPPSAKFVIR